MKPKDFTEGKLKTDEHPETYYWGFLLNCWDSFLKYQDLRAADSKAVKITSQRLTEQRTLLTPEEIVWCENVAKEDADNAPTNKNTVKEWSFIYATVTVVMRKLLTKYWTPGNNIAQTFRNKRKEYENWIMTKYGIPVEWLLPNVASGDRGSVLEVKLKKLNKPEK